MTKPAMPLVRWQKNELYALQPYKASDGWRWRVWSKNGRIVAESGEAYTRRAAALAPMLRLFPAESEWTLLRINMDACR